MTTSVTSTLANAGLSLQEKAAKVTGSNSIDQAGFLRLMTAQMEYQDPFEPMDNNQMVSQMAQLSQLEGQNNSNRTLKEIADALSGTRLSDAASWIGKSMLVKSNIAAPDRYGQYAGELTLPKDAEGVAVDLVDEAGETIRTIELGSVKAGNVGFYWDGKNEAGEQVTTQALKVRVRGAAPSQIATWASIAAVQSPAGGANAQLITPLGNYAPADALRLG
jgi:flagellar basal-body rod modification protein FlgD